ncbi:MAG: single-stranded DNA-binding protein, partial [Bacteroidaceae bacterium]|nr:single-stranded DNA-binding protein [Bacteroidaceae bacterium]
LYVEGEIYYRTIEEKNGTTRRQIEISAKNMEMLTPRKDKEEASQQ